MNMVFHDGHGGNTNMDILCYRRKLIVYAEKEKSKERQPKSEKKSTSREPKEAFLLRI